MRVAEALDPLEAESAVEPRVVDIVNASPVVGDADDDVALLAATLENIPSSSLSERSGRSAANGGLAKCQRWLRAGGCASGR